MTTEAASTAGRLSPFEQLRFGREIIRHEGQALLALARRLQDDFCDAVALLEHCRGSVIVTGMGKAGLVGQKIAATLASTGTRSHFLHPGEAVHGDLGRIHRDDVLLVLSFSGETEEIVQLLPSLRDFRTPVIAVTGRPGSSLGRGATVVLDLGPIREACSLGLAPSTSTTAMLAIGDALALVLSRMRHFGAEDFARFHPGGSLGRKLAKVEDHMRPIGECRMTIESKSVRSALVELGRPGRRSGAILLVNNDGMLTGIFTDSDLARMLEGRRDQALDGPLSGVMTRSPTSVTSGTRMAIARDILSERKISELPVVDEKGKPVGLIDITDVVGLFASEEQSTQSDEPVNSTADSADSTVDVEPLTLPFRN